MGKFAHCYDLPGGEQLLMVAFDHPENGPSVQFATEIHGQQVTAEMNLLDPEQLAQPIMRIQALADAKRSVPLYPEEAVLDIRRRLVAEHNEKKGVYNG